MCPGAWRQPECPQSRRAKCSYSAAAVANLIGGDHPETDITAGEEDVSDNPPTLMYDQRSSAAKGLSVLPG